MTTNQSESKFFEIVGILETIPVENGLLVYENLPYSPEDLTAEAQNIRAKLIKVKSLFNEYFPEVPININFGVVDTSSLKEESSELLDEEISGLTDKEKHIHRQIAGLFNDLSSLECKDPHGPYQWSEFAHNCSKTADVIDVLSCELRNYIL